VIVPSDDLAPYINAAIFGLSSGAGWWAWNQLVNTKRLPRIAASIAATAAVAVILIGANALR
jgi:hypothetical protein